MERLASFSIWQKSLDLVKKTYAFTKIFPKEETFGLVSQLRRASVSVLANTTEGLSRYMPADKANRFTIARGECSEVYALIMASIELKFVSKEVAASTISLTIEIGNVLSSLIDIHSSKAPNRKIRHASYQP